ncbi:MAG: PQ-loop repeat-containing protein [Methanobacteriota archaeon]|nr:MAG: PQ-loop repeat-containing protein [Euryarchaeota archaeon]
MEFLSWLASSAVDVFVVAGVVWPYIPQARSMLATSRPDAFSPLASACILISATARCAFWAAKPFETTLLVQAIASIITQLGLMAVIVHIKQRNRTAAATAAAAAAAAGTGGGSGGAMMARASHFTDFQLSSFWDWSDFSSYLQFEFVLAMTLLMLHGVLGSNPVYASVLGSAALGIEALLPFPQAVRNYRTKSTAGLSFVLVLSWFFGDAFKTYYAIAKGAPAQFIACGAVQFSVDVIIFVQVMVRCTPAFCRMPCLPAAAATLPRNALGGLAAPPHAARCTPPSAARCTLHAALLPCCPAALPPRCSSCTPLADGHRSAVARPQAASMKAEGPCPPRRHHRTAAAAAAASLASQPFSPLTKTCQDLPRLVSPLLVFPAAAASVTALCTAPAAAAAAAVATSPCGHRRTLSLRVAPSR